MVYMWKSEIDSLSAMWNLDIQLGSISLGSKCLYPLSHLASPTCVFNVGWFFTIKIHKIDKINKVCVQTTSFNCVSGGLVLYILSSFERCSNMPHLLSCIPYS